MPKKANTTGTKTYQRLRRLMMSLLEAGVSPSEVPVILDVTNRWLDIHYMYGSSNMSTTGYRSVELMKEEINQALTEPLEESPIRINDNDLRGIIARHRLGVGR